MRTMECQNLRREVDEAGPRDSLSAFANRHISGCVECRTFSEKHYRLQDILSNLGTIEAPGDFDFRLRARLAREKAGRAPFRFSNLSFGIRAAVAASLLFVFGSAIFIGLKTSRDNSSLANVTPPAVESPAQAGAITIPKATDEVAVVKPVVDKVNEGNFVPKRKSFSSTGVRHNSGVGTRDMASMPATVIKAADLNARVSDFPIEASNQPMRVSLDDGRGSSRTISLPAVSFGSQRVMAQGATPLMASARGAW